MHVGIVEVSCQSQRGQNQHITPGMDEDLLAIAAVNESAHQTESKTETLDGDEGDAEMWDDTMVYGLHWITLTAKRWWMMRMRMKKSMNLQVRKRVILTGQQKWF
jgi:hypothetical protein